MALFEVYFILGTFRLKPFVKQEIKKQLTTCMAMILKEIYLHDIKCPIDLIDIRS